MPDTSSRRQGVPRSIASVFGVTLGAALLAIFSVVLRIVAAVARAAAGKPQQPRREDRPAPQLRPGWSRPQPERQVQPTYWPMVLALGIAFLLWGLVSNLIISIIGLILFFFALANWIGELRHET